MGFKPTEFEGLFIYQPNVLGDHRGYFYESYNQKIFEENGLTVQFVQDNQSFSQRGVLRGLHYQLPPYAQTKLVRVIQGAVLDVVVDIRQKSRTFGKYFSIELSAQNHTQLYVPHGFAHGYVVLQNDTIFCYKCDNFYNKENERGIFFNDETIGIDWKFDLSEVILSEKDKVQPLLKNATIF